MAFNRNNVPTPAEMTIASLRNSVDILRIENTNLKADLDRERGVMRHLRRDHAAKIKQLQDQDQQNVSVKLEETKNQLQQEKEREVAKLRDSLTKEHNAEVQKLLRQKENEIKQMQVVFNKEKSELQARLNAAQKGEANTDRLHSSFEAEKSRLQQEISSLKEAKRKLEGELNSVTAADRQKAAELRQAHDELQQQAVRRRKEADQEVCRLMNELKSREHVIEQLEKDVGSRAGQAEQLRLQREEMERDMHLDTSPGSHLDTAPDRTTAVRRAGSMEGSVEEKDQMRRIWKLEDEKTTMAKQVKELETQVRPLMDKSHRLEKKLDELSGTVRRKDEENRRLREQLDIVDTRLRREAVTRSRTNSQSSLPTDDLEQLKSTITDLKKHIADSEKRRELVSLRKKKSKLPSPRKKGAKSRGVVETYFGYDEEASVSWDSESSFSIDTNSELDISFSEESDKDRLEASMQQLNQEHLQLQRAFQLLQEHLAATTDVEREGKVRAQLQTDLLAAQVKIEDLQRVLSTQGQDTGWVEEKERLNLHNRQLQDRVRELEGAEKQLQHQVADTEEQMELLEFRILELEEKERSSPLLKRQFANSDDDYSAIQRLCNEEGLQDINVFEMKRKLEDVTQKEDLDSEEQLVLLQARTILDLVDKKLKHWRSVEDDLGQKVEKLNEEKTVLTRQMSQSEDDHGAAQQHLQAANQRIKDLEDQSTAEVQAAREATATVIHSLEQENAQLKLQEAKARAEKDVAKQQADKLEGIVEELKLKLQSSTQGRNYENELLFQNLDKLKEAQKRLSDLEQEEERHKAYIKQLEDIRASYESEPESPLSLSSAGTLHKVTELEATNKSLENAPHEDTSSLKERIQDLEESERKLKTKVGELVVQGESLKEENSQLNERVTLLEESNKELQILVEELSTSEVSLKAENTELKERILKMSEHSLKDADGQKERIQDLEESINKYKELIDKLTYSGSKLEMENADLKEKLQDLEVHEQPAESNPATSSSETIALKNRIQEVEEDYRKTKDQAKDLTARESILREENHNLKEIIEEIEKQASDFKEMMETLTASEKRLEDKNAKLKDEVTRLKSLAESTTEENYRLKMEAEKYSSTQDELSQVLEHVRAAEVELKKECLSLKEKVWLLEEKETTLKEVVKDFKSTEGDLQDENNRLKDELEDIQETMRQLEIAGSSLPGFGSEGSLPREGSVDLDEDETELWKKLENWDFREDGSASVKPTIVSEEKETQTDSVDSSQNTMIKKDSSSVDDKGTQTIKVTKEEVSILVKTSMPIRVPKILEEKQIQTDGKEEVNITNIEKENVRLIQKISELEESLNSFGKQDRSRSLSAKPEEPKVGYGFAHFWPDISESAKKRIRELEANKHALQEELERVKKCESHLRARNTELETSIHQLSANLSRAHEGKDLPDDYDNFKEDQEQQECAIGTLEMATMVFEKRLAHQKARGEELDRAIFGVDPAECRRVNCPLLWKHHQLLKEEERLKLKIRDLEMAITTYREQLAEMKGAEKSDLLQKVVELEVQQKNLLEEKKEMARVEEELRVQITDLKATEEGWRMRVQELEGVGQSGTESESESHARRTIKELELAERRLQLELEEAKAAAESLKDRVLELERIERELREELAKTKQERDEANENDKSLSVRIHELEESESQMKSRLHDAQTSEILLTESLNCANEKVRELGQSLKCANTKVDELAETVKDFTTREEKMTECIKTLEKSEQELMEKLEKANAVSRPEVIGDGTEEESKSLQKQTLDSKETKALLEKRVTELEASETALRERVEFLEKSENHLMDKLEKTNSIAEQCSELETEVQLLRKQVRDFEVTEILQKERIDQLEALEGFLPQPVEKSEGQLTEQSELQEVSSGAGSELQLLRRQMSEFEETEAQLREKIAELEAAEQTLQERVEILEKSEEELMQKLKKASSISQPEDPGRDPGSELQWLRSQLIDSEETETQLRARIADLEASEEALRETLGQADSIMSEREAGFKDQIEVLHLTQVKLKERIFDLETSEEELKEQLFEFGVVFDDEDLEKKERKKSFRDQETEGDSLADEIGKLHGTEEMSASESLTESAMLEKPDVDWKNKSKELKAEDQHLSERYKFLEESKASLTQQVKDLQGSEENLKQEVEILNDVNGSLENELEDLRMSEKALKDTVNELQQENGNLKERIKELEQRISNLANTEKQTTKSKAEEDLDELLETVIQEKSDLEEKVQELEASEKLLRNELQELQKAEERGQAKDVKDHDLAMENSELKMRIQELEEAETALNKRIVDLRNAETQKQTADAQHTAQEMEKENEELKAKLQDLEKSGLGETVAELMQEKEQLEKKVLDLEEKDLQQQERILEMEMGADVSDRQELSSPSYQKGTEDLGTELEEAKKRIAELEGSEQALLDRLDDLEYQQQQDSTDMVQLPREELDRLKAQVSLLRETEDKLDDLEEEDEKLRDTVQSRQQSRTEAETSKLQKKYEALQQEHEELQTQVHELRAKLREATLAVPVQDVRNKRTQTDLSWMDGTVDQYGRVVVAEPLIPRPASSPARSTHPIGRMSPEELDQQVQNLDVNVANLLEEKLQRQPVLRGVPPLPTSTPPHFRPRSGSLLSQHTLGDVSDMDSEADPPPLPNSTPPTVRPRALTTESEGSEAGALPAILTSPPTPPPEGLPQSQNDDGADTDQEGEDLPQEGAVAARVAAFEAQSPLKSPGDGSMPDSGLGTTLLGGDSSLDTTATPPTGLFDPQEQINQWVENRRQRKGLSRGFTMPVGTRRRRFYDRSEDNSLADDSPAQIPTTEDSADEQNVRELKETIEQLQNDNQEKDEALKNLQKALEESREEMKDKEGKLEDVNKAERKLQEDLKKHARDLAHGREEIQYLEQTLREKEEDLQRLREDQRQLERDLRAKEDAMASSAQIREKVLGQEKELQDKDDYLHSLEKQCRELKQEVERLKRELERKERDSDVTYYKAQVQMKEGEIHHKDEELHRLRSENRKLEGEAQQADRQCRRLQKEKDGLQAQVERLQQLDQECAELQKLQDTLKKENDQLLRKSEKLQKAEQEIHLLRETVATLRAHLRDIEAVDKEKEDLRARLDAISDLKQRMDAIPTSDYDTDHPGRSSPYMISRTLPADLNMKDLASKSPASSTSTLQADIDEADSGRASDISAARRQMVRHSTPTTMASPSPSAGTRPSPLLDDIDVLPTRLQNGHAIRDDLDLVPVRRRRKERPKMTAGQSSPELMLELHESLQAAHTNNYDVPFLPLPIPKLDSPEHKTRRPRPSPGSDGNRHRRDHTPHQSGPRSHSSRSRKSPKHSRIHISPQDALSRTRGPNWYPPPLNNCSSQLAVTNGLAEHGLINGHGVTPLANGMPSSFLTNGHGGPSLTNGMPASLLTNGIGGERARRGSGASGSWLTVSSTADALSTVSQATTSPRQQGPPQPPSDLRIHRTVGKSSVLVGWTLPPMDDMGNSNGVQVSGYKIKVDGEETQVVPSSHVSKALVEGLDLTVPFLLSVQTVSADRQLSDRVEVEFTDLQEPPSVLTSSRPSSALSEDTSVYSDPVIEEPARMFLAVYNYSPSRNSPNHYPEDELGLREGDVVTVFGPLREDGFYEGKVDGQRGLVPASFLEEISTSQDRLDTDTHRKHHKRSPSKRHVSKQKEPRRHGATTHKDRRQRVV